MGSEQKPARYKFQEVDLLNTYTRTQLDTSPPPPITVGEYNRGYDAGGPGDDSPDFYRLFVGLYDESGVEIENYSTPNRNTKSFDSWEWVGKTFTGYAPGVRYIRIFSYGQDAGDWNPQTHVFAYDGTQTDATQVRVSVGAGATVGGQNYTACNGNGTCSVGAHGDGICTCDQGYSGPNCGIPN
jgi:hypothetical protein